MAAEDAADPTEFRGTILTPQGWIAGRLRYGETITGLDGSPIGTPTPPFLVPGFVDLHVHGGGGADMMAGEAELRAAARAHARHGTTALLATTVTAPVEEIAAVLDAIAIVMERPGAGEAAVLGAHLEGPFINPHKLGAQPPHAIPGDPAIFAALAERAPIRVATVAPEVDPDGALIDAMTAAGVAVQIGHSLCDHARAAALFRARLGVTHLYNAMTPLAHRAPGLVGAALAHAETAEIIADLIHVAPDAILAARRAIPGLYGVTDASAGAGAPDGTYRLGRHEVVKAEGAMRLADGTLAGSALTMDQALRNLVAIGLSLDEAARRLSALPAERLGDAARGRIAAGARADFVLLDGDLSVLETVIGGRRVAGEPT